MRAGQIGADVALSAATLLLWALLLGRKRRFRTYFIAVATAASVLLFLDAGALAFLPGGEIASVRRAARDALLGLVPAFLGRPILLASRRVRETLTG